MKSLKIALCLALSLNLVLAETREEILNSYQQTLELDKKMDARADNEPLSQFELNELAQKNYELWDKELNRVWAYLKQNLPKERMQSLTVKQRKWIKDKEDKAKKQANAVAGSGASRGSMWNLIYYGELSQLTEKRVKELMKLVKAKKSSAKSKSSPAKTKGDIFKAYGNLIDEDAKIQSKIRGENLEGVIKLSKKQYNLWDKHLNLVWKYLKNNYPKNEMEFLTNKQRDWVNYKENLAKQRANNADNYDLAYYMTLTEETKKKVEELMNLIK